jgi:hypothetical protein
VAQLSHVIRDEAGEDGDIDLFSGELAPFTLALIVMLAIGAIELLSLIVGFSPSSSIESVLPEVEVPDVDVPDAPGADPGLGGANLGPLSALLGWLSVGRLPILILFVIFLTAFALTGYLVQGLARSAIGSPVNAWIAVMPALAGGAYATRHIGRWLGRIFPRDHTEAASQKELIGSYATIIRGEAKRGQPAEAKTTDLRGRTHYVLIEPSEAETTYTAGDRVFIVGKDKNIYRAVTRLQTQQG